MIIEFPAEVLWILALVIVPMVLLAIGIKFWKTLLKKNTVAETEPVPDRAFRIGFVTEKTSRYRIMMYFRINYEGSEDNYGVWADYAVEQQGAIVRQESAGAGNLLPPGTREITTQYFTSSTGVAGMYDYRSTIQLFRTGKCMRGQEIRVTGTVHSHPGTVIKELKIQATR